MVFNALDESFACFTIDILYCVVSMCIHYCNFIPSNVIGAYMRSTNDIKVDPLTANSYVSNKFC